MRLVGGSGSGDSEMRAAARRWATTWQAAWAAHDQTAIAALYAPGAHFQPHAFRPPLPVERYLQQVFDDEVAADPHFDEPVVDGRRAAVHWRATTRLRDSTTEDLVGVSLLTFDDRGLVTEQRDYWADGAAGLNASD